MVACRWWITALWSASLPRWTVCEHFSTQYMTPRMRIANDGRPSQRCPDLHADLPGVHHPHLGECLSASVVERVRQPCGNTPPCTCTNSPGCCPVWPCP